MKQQHPTTLGELLAKDFQGKEQIWGPAITTHNFTHVVGEGGAGKSFFVLGLAYAIAGGVPFLKFHTNKPRKVGLVDGELGEANLKFRTPEMLDALRVDPVADSVRFIDGEFCGGLVENLASPQGQAFYNYHLASCDVLIFDNYDTVTREVGDRDNMFAMWSRVQNWILETRRNGKAIIIVDHTNKSKETRGTQKKYDLCNTSIIIRKPTIPTPNLQGVEFELHFTKHRDFWGLDTEALFCRYTKQFPAARWEWMPLEHRLAEVIAQMREAIGKKATKRQVSEQLGVPLYKVAQLWDEKYGYTPPTTGGHGYVEREDEDEKF